MTPFEITVLDEQETENILQDRQWSSRSAVADVIAQLRLVVDSGSGIFVAGLTDGNVNTIRTSMKRKGLTISVTRFTRSGVKGHVIVAKTA